MVEKKSEILSGVLSGVKTERKQQLGKFKILVLVTPFATILVVSVSTGPYTSLAAC
jgi:hypothetical protein